MRKEPSYILASVLAFILTVLATICISPYLVYVVLRTYNRYLSRLYARMLFRLSFDQVLEAMVREEWS